MKEKEFYSETSTSLLSYSKNVRTVDENIIFEGLGVKGYQEGITITDFIDKKTADGNTVGGHKYVGKAPVKPQDGEPTQLAISKGVLYDLYKKNPNNGLAFNGSTLSPGLLNDQGYMANFKITGLKRSQAIYNFIVTAVVDTDDYVIYLPSYTYQAYLNNSFNRGGYLVMTVNENTNINADIYRDMLNKNITINNQSFKKLQLVDNFINDNLFLFAAMFFVFCLFSILMIFNFIMLFYFPALIFDNNKNIFLREILK